VQGAAGTGAAPVAAAAARVANVLAHHTQCLGLNALVRPLPRSYFDSIPPLVNRCQGRYYVCMHVRVYI
jgi:hypothetical protein